MSLPPSTLSSSLPSTPERLYYEHHGWLRRWLQRHTGDHGTADDLAQDTFVRLLTGAGEPAVAVLQTPRAYLATIARRLLLNHLRRQSLELAWQETLASLPPEGVPSPELQVALWQQLRQVDAWLGGLPDKVRTVFLLAQVEGLTYAEIAAQQGIGLRSVKRYMAQALAECILLAEDDA